MKVLAGLETLDYGADERGFFARADQPVGIQKQNSRPKALAGIL
jgi:hypothetical protein